MSSSESEDEHRSGHSSHVQPSEIGSRSRASSRSPSRSSQRHRHRRSHSKSKVTDVEKLGRENQKLKRKIDALQLENAAVSKKSRKKGAEKSLENQGRALARIATLYTPIASLVRCFFAYDTDAEQEDDDDVDPVDLNEKELEEYFKHQMEKRKIQRDIRAYHIVVKTVPGFQKAVDAAGTDIGAILTLCKQLQYGSISARSDDVHTLMIELANWLNFRPLPSRADPLLLNHSRELRGFKHNLTGKLLCPVEYDWSDSVVRAKIQNKEIKTNTSFFIRAFYRGEEGNPDNVEEGFLRSTLLVQTWRQIYRASGSISEDEIPSTQSDLSNAPAPIPQSNKARSSTKQSLAELYGLNQVTPRTIAYSCVLLRFSLSHAKKWGQDRSFNYEGLYNEIVDYFEAADPEDEEVQTHLTELLQWWNEQAFAEEDASNSLKPSLHFQSTLEEQRAAKMSAAAAAEAAAVAEAAAAAAAAAMVPVSGSASAS